MAGLLMPKPLLLCSGLGGPDFQKDSNDRFPLEKQPGEAGSLSLRLEEHLAHLYGKEVAPLREAVNDDDFEAASRLLAQLTATLKQISAGQPSGAGGN